MKQHIPQASASARDTPPDQLVAIHNLTEEALHEVVRLGGLPSPSVGITKVETPFEDFGPISLIGTSALADPAHIPVYSRDRYTPSAPRNSRGQPLRMATLEEALARMTCPAARRRRGPYTTGRALADVGRRFAGMEELRDARGSVVEPDLMRRAREDLDELMDSFVRAVLGMSGSCPPVSAAAGEPVVLRALTNGCRHGATPESLRNALARASLPPVSGALLEQGSDIMRRMLNLPTDYFEAKPRRIVRLGEFAGAALPARTPDVLIRALHRAGLKIQFYPEEREGAQAVATRSLAYALARERADILFRIDNFLKDVPPSFPSARGARIYPGGMPPAARSAIGNFFSPAPLFLRFIPPWILAMICAILIRHAFGFCLLEYIAKCLAPP